MLKGKALISILLRIAWSVLIYHVWRKRNSRLYSHNAESYTKVMEKIKEEVRFRMAGLKGVEADYVNCTLCNNWGLFDFILV